MINKILHFFVSNVKRLLYKHTTLKGSRLQCISLFGFICQIFVTVPNMLLIFFSGQPFNCQNNSGHGKNSGRTCVQSSPVFKSRPEIRPVLFINPGRAISSIGLVSPFHNPIETSQPEFPNLTILETDRSIN